MKRKNLTVWDVFLIRRFINVFLIVKVYAWSDKLWQSNSFDRYKHLSILSFLEVFIKGRDFSTFWGPCKESHPFFNLCVLRNSFTEVSKITEWFQKSQIVDTQIDQKANEKITDTQFYYSDLTQFTIV